MVKSVAELSAQWEPRIANKTNGANASLEKKGVKLELYVSNFYPIIIFVVHFLKYLSSQWMAGKKGEKESRSLLPFNSCGRSTAPVDETGSGNLPFSESEGMRDWA